MFRQPSVEGHLSKLSNGSSSKFGSTPLFSQIMQPLPPPPPQHPTATTRPPRLPTGRMQHSMKHPGCPTVPASISCHENIVRNDYSIPGGSTIPISHSLAQPIQIYICCDTTQTPLKRPLFFGTTTGRFGGILLYFQQIYL